MVGLSIRSGKGGGNGNHFTGKAGNAGKSAGKQTGRKTGKQGKARTTKA